jgi:Ca2+-transporting ATPase
VVYNIGIIWILHEQISTVIGVAVKSQREESAWSEGVAIWIAVLVVSFVGKAP